MSFLIAQGCVRLERVNVIVGHYGVGKTNLSLNLALDAAAEGYHVTLIDLDVVNPYFRSSEYRDLLEQMGVRLIAPVFAEAGTGLDVPSLTGAIIPAIEEAYVDEDPKSDDVSASSPGKRSIVIIDAGGDEVGAAALGRFRAAIDAGSHAVFYITNSMRNLTQRPEDAFEILREIEVQSRLCATALISNAHLKSQTDFDTIKSGIDFTHILSDMTGLPLVSIAVPKALLSQEKSSFSQLEDAKKLYPISLYVKTPWE